MRFVFRRGMVLLYIGLIASYGAIGLVPSLVQDQTIKTVFTGFLWTSTILHYYMDGFIWKVRESSTQASLGLTGTTNATAPRIGVGGVMHLLKWSPLLAFVCWLFLTDLDHSSISSATAKELDAQFTENIMSSNSLPDSEEKQSWIYSRFLQVQNVAAALPNNRRMQSRAAIMLANFGRDDEAKAILERQLESDPHYVEAYQMLGGIQFKKGNLDAALVLFEKAMAQSQNREQRTNTMISMGNIYMLQGKSDLAKAKFLEAIKENPKLEASIDALRKKNQSMEIAR